jgi:glycosyltransferase involved in cell wall biosynthesis
VAEPKISVAVATRNRPDSVDRLLSSLRAQEPQPYEVIVGDDSTDQFAPAVRRIVERHRYSYSRAPQRGLFANRNATAQLCTGTHIRTMDDDHEFPQGHWARCEEVVREDSESVWIIGETVPTEGLLDPDRPPGELHPRGFALPPRDPDDTWAISDGASIYPASIFRSGIRFSEAFRFGLGFQEFGSRLHWLGYRIRYLRGTYVIHHMEPTHLGRDLAEDLAAKAFATISFSYRHQPTLWNKARTSAELVREAAKLGRPGIEALRRGYREYKAFGADEQTGQQTG